MFPRVLDFAAFVILFQVSLCEYGDTSIPDQFILTTSKLPTDLNFMPSLANGHLGFTVFGDSIYMNGVYNGLKGNSRRARLPNWLNVNASTFGPEETNFTSRPPDIYSMNLLEGVFEWTQIYTYYNMSMRQRVYAHRFYNRALVYEVTALREICEDTIIIELQNNAGPDTLSFDLMEVPTSSDDIRMLLATKKQVENTHFQPQPTQIYVALSESFKDSKKRLVMEENQKTLYYRFVLTADFDKQVALNEMKEVLGQTENNLIQKHTTRWREFWNNFHIDIRNNLELAQITNAATFYLANSLPSMDSFHRNNAYFGLSPTGLARGALNADYEGHNFWDTETWMLPVVTQLSNAWSRQLFKYRLDHLEGALYNANLTGFKGARFPWESAYTGTEVTNPCCPEVATQEIHISADIAVALKHFYSTTDDQEWLCSSAWPLLREIASFLSSRIIWDQSRDQYHIKNVMGPDEDHENVDDNVYTNVVTKIALQFACFSQEACLPNSNQPTEEGWLEKANKMFIMYDAMKDFHPQDRDYQSGEEVKQADTILLGYPLQYDMANSTRYNDLLMYENVTRSSGPAMTWSMFAINFLDVGNKQKADMYFIKGYRDYVRPEFKVWSETQIGYQGSANFLTGIGGFLQSIVNGFAGIRFELQNNKTSMVIKNTSHLPGTKEYMVKGFKFANSSFSLYVRQNGTRDLTCLQLGKHMLVVTRQNMPPTRIFTGLTIKFQTESISVQTT